ncbi:MAG: rod shape-determining protein MreC [Candidatus Omnitrophota bacterium]
MRGRWFKNLRLNVQLLVSVVIIVIIAVFSFVFTQHISTVILPLISAPLQFCEDISVTARNFLTFEELSLENKKLKKKIADLDEQLIQMQETSRENIRLRRLLFLQQKIPISTQAALIIGKDCSDWTKTILINKGASSGITKGMPVIFGAGLVGKVSESSANVSRVELIVDANVKIPAKILRTKEEGIIFGNSNLHGNICNIKYIHDIKIGDTIVSSGLGKIYPQGFLIGTVTAVDKTKNNLYKIAVVKPEVNFSALEEVMVITGGQK